jgi:hypothetical protein
MQQAIRVIKATFASVNNRELTVTLLKWGTTRHSYSTRTATQLLPENIEEYELGEARSTSLDTDWDDEDYEDDEDSEDDEAEQSDSDEGEDDGEVSDEEPEDESDEDSDEDGEGGDEEGEENDEDGDDGDDE